MPSPNCWPTAANAPRSSMARWDAARPPSVSATAAVLHAEGHRRTLVLSPPTWSTGGAAEIQETVARRRSGCSMAPDTLVKLIKLRASSWACRRAARFFVPGACGCAWVSTGSRLQRCGAPAGDVGACPDCGQVITNLDGEPINPVELEAEDYRRQCSHCAAPLWTLMRPRSLSASDQSTAVFKAL